MASPGTTSLVRRHERTFDRSNGCSRFAHRIIVAAVCYRFPRDGGIEFMLVRTGSGRWTFPKGGVDKDASLAAAAAREAHEEAGVIGRVDQSCLTRYLHRKTSWGTQIVHAHLCEVTHVGSAAEPHREPTWFSPEGAKKRLRESRPAFFGNELEQVVNAALRHFKNAF